MNLYLQGLQADRSTIEKIAALARASKITPVGAHAFRCEKVTIDASVKGDIDAACSAAELDYAIWPDNRRLTDFKLVAMDMDSTLITIECIDEIADMQGLKAEVSSITEAAMRGEIEFPESLARRVALLRGLDAGALQRVYDERMQLSPGALPMLQAMQKAGLKTLLVSGGFTFFTDRLRASLNLDYSRANELEIVDGKLTGKVSGTIVDAEEKMHMVERVCADMGISSKQAIVLGDGANDLRMMGIAGLSVAFRAKPKVRAQADVALNHVGLDGLLTFLN